MKKTLIYLRYISLFSIDIRSTELSVEEKNIKLIKEFDESMLKNVLALRKNMHIDEKKILLSDLEKEIKKTIIILFRKILDNFSSIVQDYKIDDLILKDFLENTFNKDIFNLCKKSYNQKNIYNQKIVINKNRKKIYTHYTSVFLYFFIFFSMNIENIDNNFLNNILYYKNEIDYINEYILFLITYNVTNFNKYKNEVLDNYKNVEVDLSHDFTYFLIMYLIYDYIYFEYNPYVNEEDKDINENNKKFFNNQISKILFILVNNLKKHEIFQETNTPKYELKKKNENVDKTLGLKKGFESKEYVYGLIYNNEIDKNLLDKLSKKEQEIIKVMFECLDKDYLKYQLINSILLSNINNINPVIKKYFYHLFKKGNMCEKLIILYQELNIDETITKKSKRGLFSEPFLFEDHKEKKFGFSIFTKAITKYENDNKNFEEDYQIYLNSLEGDNFNLEFKYDILKSINLFTSNFLEKESTNPTYIPSIKKICLKMNESFNKKYTLDIDKKDFKDLSNKMKKIILNIHLNSNNSLKLSIKDMNKFFKKTSLNKYFASTHEIYDQKINYKITYNKETWIDYSYIFTNFFLVYL